MDVGEGEAAGRIVDWSYLTERSLLLDVGRKYAREVTGKQTCGSPRPFATLEAFRDEAVARVGTAPATGGRG
ncbi:hypothetical protein ACNPQM_23130 [Streptomyces sp. NPDC056231]|uniref:hypothetical protein n=1 Tax=Streptomyces sp. NPDC056231 TaxID=3345755 RepID=UPI003AAA932C